MLHSHFIHRISQSQYAPMLPISEMPAGKVVLSKVQESSANAASQYRLIQVLGQDATMFTHSSDIEQNIKSSSSSLKYVMDPKLVCCDEQSPSQKEFYSYHFEFPAEPCQPLRSRLIEQKESFVMQSSFQQLDTVVGLVKAVRELHSRNFYLMDLSISQSIFMKTFDDSFVLAAVRNSSNVLQDRQSILQKYVDSMKAVDPFDIFLYPPEILKGLFYTSEFRSEFQLKRDRQGDVWAFGVLMLLLFGLDEKDVQASIQSKEFNLEIFKSKKFDPIQKLLQKVFRRNPKERPSLNGIMKVICSIQKLKYSTPLEVSGEVLPSEMLTCTFEEEDDSGDEGEKGQEVDNDDEGEKEKEITIIVEQSENDNLATSVFERMLKSGQLEEATEKLKQLQTERQLNKRELIVFAKILFARELYDEAIAIINGFMSFGDKELKFEGLRLLGLIHKARGEYKQSLQYFVDCQNATPIFQDALFQQGVIHLLQRSSQAAVIAFQSCYKKSKNNSLIKFQLAKALAAHRQYDEAFAFFDQIACLKPEYEEAYQEIMDDFIDYKNDILTPEMAQKKGENNDYFLLVHCLRLNGCSKVAIEAIQLTKQIFSLTKNESSGLSLEQGLCQLEIKQFDEAIKSLLHAEFQAKQRTVSFNVSAMPEIYNALGNVYAEKLQIEKAVEYYLLSHSSSQSEGEKNRVQGNLFSMLQPFMCQLFQELQENPEDSIQYAESLSRLGSLYHKKLNCSSDAIAVWQHCLNIECISNFMQASLFLNIGNAFLTIKNIQNAKEYLYYALNANEKEFQAHFLLAQIFEKDSPQVACDHLMKGLAINTNVQALFRLGVIHKKLKCFEESLEAFSQCLAICDMGFPSIYEHLGEVYSSLNLFEESCVCHSVNYQLHPSSPQSKQLYGIALFMIQDYKNVLNVIVGENINAEKIDNQKTIFKSPQLIYIIGECLFQEKLYELAINVFNRIQQFSNTEYFMKCIDHIYLWLISKQNIDSIRIAIKNHIDFVNKSDSVGRFTPSQIANVYCILTIIYLSTFDLINARLTLEKAETADASFNMIPIVKAKLILLSEQDIKFVEKALSTLYTTDEKMKDTDLFRVVSWEINAKANHFSYLEDELETFNLLGSMPHMITFYNYTKAIWMVRKDQFILKDSLITKEYSVAPIQKDIDKVLLLLEGEKYAPCELLLVKILLRKNQIERVIDLLSNFLKRLPFYVYALRLQSNILVIQKDYKQFETIINILFKINPNDVKTRNEVAKLYMQDKKYWKAIVELENSLSIEPENESTYILLIEAHSMVKKTLAAIQIATTYLKRNVYSIDVLLALAQVYKNQLKYKEAKNCLKQISTIAPYMKESSELLGEINIAESNWEQLNASYDKLNSLATTDNLFQLTLGKWARILWKQMQNREFITISLSHYERYFTQNAQHVQSLEQIVLLNYDLNKYAKCQEIFSTNQLSKKFTNPEVLAVICKLDVCERNFARALIALNQVPPTVALKALDIQYYFAYIRFVERAFTKAQHHISICQKLLKTTCEAAQFANESEVWYLSAAIAQARGQMHSPVMDTIYRNLIAIPTPSYEANIIHAEIDAEKYQNYRIAAIILDLYPTDMYTQRMLLLRYEVEYAHLKTLTDAEERNAQIEKIKTILHSTSEQKCAFLCAQAGLFHLEIREEVEGQALLEQAVSLYSVQQKSVYNKPLTKPIKLLVSKRLAEIYCLSNEHDILDKALKQVKIALKLEPKNIDVQNLAAQVEFKYHLGSNKAINRLKSLIKDEKANFNTYFILGNIYLAQQSYQKALVYYKKCLIQDPSNMQIQQIVAQFNDRMSKQSEADSFFMKLLEKEPTNIKYLIPLADILLSNDRLDELENRLEQQFKIHPQTDFDLMVLQARLLKKRGNYSAAKALYQNIREMHTERIRVCDILDIAALHAQSKDIAGEKACYLEVINRKDAGLAEDILQKTYLNLANVYAFEGDIPKAIATLLSCCSQDSLDYEQLGNLALFYAAQGKYDDAMQHIDRALEKNGKNAQLMFVKAFLLAKSGQLSTAIAAYTLCLELNPDCIPAAINLCIIQRKFYNNTTAAHKTLMVITMRYPKNLQILYHCVLNQLYANNYGPAAKLLNEIIQSYSELLLYTQSSINEETNQFKTIFKLSHSQATHDTDSSSSESDQPDALERDLQYVSKDSSCPDLIQFNLLLALCYRRLKQYDEATIHLLKCMKMDVNNCHYMYSLAYTYYLMGDIVKAEVLLIRCSQLNPASIKVYNFMLSNMIHNLKGREGVADEEEWLNSCIKSDNNFARAYQNLGCMHMSEHKYDQAIIAFEKFVQLRPNSPEGQYNLGNAYVFSGEKDQAIGCFKKCLALSSNHYRCNYNLGLVYKATGQDQLAAQLFQKCFEINPKDHKRITVHLHELHKKLISAQLI